MSTSSSSTLPAVGERDPRHRHEQPQADARRVWDFGCPYCFQASRPVKSVLDGFDGLRLVWRHFPVSALPPRADLAELSELAGCTGSSGTDIRCSSHRVGGSHTTTCSRWQGDLSSTQRRPARPFASTGFESASSPTSRAAGQLESTRHRPSSSMASASTGPGANSCGSCGQASRQPDRPAVTSRGRARRPIDAGAQRRSATTRFRVGDPPHRAAPARHRAAAAGRPRDRAEPDREDGPQPARHVSATTPPAWRARRRRGLRATG